MITLQELQTDPKYRSMSREELANIINGNDFLWNDYLQLEGSFSDDKAANLIASWKAKEDNKIQEGATIYAINECIMKGSENPTLTIGKGYVVQYIESSKYFSIIDDENETHVFYLTEFNKYFTFKNPKPIKTMANFKIIETGSEYPDVLLYRNIDDNSNEIVIIKAFGTINNQDNTMLEEQVSFESTLLACSFIDDFSVKSAEEWCKSEGISYSKS